MLYPVRRVGMAMRLLRRKWWNLRHQLSWLHDLYLYIFFCLGWGVRLQVGIYYLLYHRFFLGTGIG